MNIFNKMCIGTLRLWRSLLSQCLRCGEWTGGPPYCTHVCALKDNHDRRIFK